MRYSNYPILEHSVYLKEPGELWDPERTPLWEVDFTSVTTIRPASVRPHLNLNSWEA